jgi:hypothetical protein
MTEEEKKQEKKIIVDEDWKTIILGHRHSTDG